MAILKTTWNHARRSPYQAFAAVFIIAQTFFVASIFTFFILGSAAVIQYFESLPQVTVFFKNDAKQEKIDALKDQIQSTGKVSKIRFVSQQEALKIYREQNKEDPLLLDLVTADILPSSLEISTTKINDLSSISEMLHSSTIIKSIIFPKDVIARLSEWTNSLRKIGIVLITVLGIDSIFIMVIIISIKISQKKEEIEILRLIGATSGYIRRPFLLEGIGYGVVGAFLGWVLATGTLLYATPFLSSFLKGIPLFPISPVFFLELLGVEFVLAILLGVFSSFLAVFRYLK